METSRRWPLAGAAMFLAAASCVAGFVVAPIPALVIASLILIAAAVLRARLGSWQLPVLVTSAVATLLASGMLLLSVDFGIDGCPDGRCDQETPVSEVPIPG